MNRPRVLTAAARPLTGVALLLVAAFAAACSPNSPAASGAAPGTSNQGPATSVTVTLTPAGCAPIPASVPAGAISFTVTNQGADSVSEVELKQGDQIFGERENMTPGVTGTFSAQLAAGSYVIECPGATTDQTPFTVTAAAGASSAPANRY